MGLINIRRCQREWGSLKTQKLPWAVFFMADCTYQRRSKDLPSIKSPSRPSAVLLFSDLPQTKIVVLSVKFKFGHCANKPHDAAEISWTISGKSLAGITNCLLFLFSRSQALVVSPCFYISTSSWLVSGELLCFREWCTELRITLCPL